MGTNTLSPQASRISATVDGQATKEQPARLLSLDAVRGFDMFWIIGGQDVVRGLAKACPGRVSSAIARQFEHVPWQGLHLFDVIWTLFMFIVGVSLSFSIASRKRRNETKANMFRHAATRALILFVLGMAAQGNLLDFSLATLHPFYSVLHGIAAGYLIATVLALSFRIRGQAALTATFLIVYWILLLLIPVPGVGRGVLTPTGNAAAYIDTLLQGRFHFGENTWFLNYLGFASSVMLGVFAGNMLLSMRPPERKVAMLFGYGAALLISGLIWSIWLPVIKLLWTSSFVLVAGGISCLLLAIFYLIIDVMGYRKWAFPFSVIGMNALAVYMATELFDFRHIGDIFVGHLLPRVGLWDGALGSSAAVMIIWLLLYWMYKTRTFINL